MLLPIRDSYRVADGLLAGAYPGSHDPAEAARRLRAFHEHGVTLFVDLTHPADSLEPYERARALARAPRRRIRSSTWACTTIPHMTRILDEVDGALADGGSVYVHCWGGIGRTGTVVGCWLVRHGLDGGDRGRADRRAAAHGLGRAVASPETAAQRAMVEAWKRGR